VNVAVTVAVMETAYDRQDEERHACSQARPKCALISRSRLSASRTRSGQLVCATQRDRAATTKAAIPSAKQMIAEMRSPRSDDQFSEVGRPKISDCDPLYSKAPRGTGSENTAVATLAAATASRIDAARMRGQNRPRCTTGQHRPTLRTLDRSGLLTHAPNAGLPDELAENLVAAA
jgi:hypothetical protein